MAGSSLIPATRKYLEGTLPQLQTQCQKVLDAWTQPTDTWTLGDPEPAPATPKMAAKGRNAQRDKLDREARDRRGQPAPRGWAKDGVEYGGCKWPDKGILCSVRDELWMDGQEDRGAVVIDSDELIVIDEVAEGHDGDGRKGKATMQNNIRQEAVDMGIEHENKDDVKEGKRKACARERALDAMVQTQAEPPAQ
ncbi:uncharacterized protein BO97DRAFT_422468 [Aspergillus homomorphus CBS 101889]|uniref:Uncharacterized protein n=1 Tax=Aspergillus homomorphus (strain CBS 101889) TaxID=1450537 RepID=A0A395I3N3_ASPHC|nr:hypothetical protein BO97DRAFT_422468 [Aspergillus homomorphus CBS 101889]RAL14567.1 hypothetical protein BO97DRAFT_422468 [Aspergillus homomorphus CBS 101889]